MYNGEKYVLLNDCSVIRTGQTFKSSPQFESEGNVSIIQPRDLDDGKLTNALTRVHGNGISVLQKHLLKPGEILIANKGTKLGTFLYEGEPERTIATAAFFVLSPHPWMLPAYLNWYLNQAPARGYFVQHTFGSVIPSINKSILGELLVPMLPLEEQQHIGALLKETAEEQNILKLLAGRKKEYANSYIWEQIIKNHERTT